MKKGIGNLTNKRRDAMKGNIDSVLKQVADQEIQFVQLWFTDLLGNLKSIEIPSSGLPNALEQGIGFDGSSIHGFA
ncbi:glutamine synthetase, partial [Candidatus Bipolaricaulota bacterium]|nr:glutamine synthetase [Candidatus Bipolaricaulota bacterium]